MTASLTLIVAGSATAIVDLWLTVICLRCRAVLGETAALVGWALLGFAVARRLDGVQAHAAVVIAGAFVLLGAALFGLGGWVERLLEDPDDGAQS